MIKIDNLTKKYNDQFAVKSLSLNIDEGNVLGFLGPNGAGKTTTMKMITGFISPDTGDVIVDGLSVKDNSYAVRQSIGYLPEGAPHYGEMMTKDFLKFIIKIRDIKNKDSLDFVIESLSLKNILNKRIEHLSKGFKRRVGLAQAIIHDPKYLILDEPTDGLDPNQKHDVRELIKKISPNKTIIISTHILEEVDAICSKVSIISEGSLVFYDTTQKFMSCDGDSNDEIFRKLTLG